MYSTTNGFNHDKSQPDHTSQNMHVMVYEASAHKYVKTVADMICWLVIMLHIHTKYLCLNIFGTSVDMCILLEYVIVNVILGCILILNTLIRLILITAQVYKRLTLHGYRVFKKLCR